MSRTKTPRHDPLALRAGLAALALSGALVLATPAVAQPKAGSDGVPLDRGVWFEEMFDEIDRDGDGIITRREMDEHRRARFQEADTDGDGRLSRDEMIAAREARMEARMDRRMRLLDANDDGHLSFDEMPGPGGRMMRWADLNDDGAIDREEMQAMRDRMMNRHGGMGGGTGRGCPN